MRLLGASFAAVNGTNNLLQVVQYLQLGGYWSCRAILERITYPLFN
jgi:hypothetical protein